MTGPARCSSCRTDFFLWHGLDIPAGPGREHTDGECYACSKVSAQANGGLPRADLRSRPLDQLLAALDQADERQALRLRGVKYVVQFGGIRAEVEA